MRVMILVISLLSISSCARWHHSTPKKNPVVHKNGPITAFTQVEVDGNIDIQLFTGSKAPQVILQADIRDRSGVFMHVRNGVLYISVGKGYPHFGTIHADVHSRYLTHFTYHGHGTITGRNIQSKRLDITLQNDSKTQLQGQINLHALTIKGTGITQISGIHSSDLNITLSGKPHVELAGIMNASHLSLSGNSWLSLYWVKSQHLHIRAKNHAFVQLAGKSDMLDVVVHNNARINSRYLRSKQLFIKTYDNAVADIAVTGSQHTLASDHSNIYFYTIPDFKTDFMANSGAVLDMRPWDNPVLEERNRYNR